MEDFTYKKLTSEHASDWRELRLEGARDFPLGFLVTLEETAAVHLDQCVNILSHGSIRGVCHGEKVVGFCGYRPQQMERIRHRGEIGPFFVTRLFQGRGAAKAMMWGVINEAKAEGVEQLELFVDAENSRAIAFYERFGFERKATYNDSVRIDGQSRNDHLYILRL